MIYYDHGILSPSRAHDWLYCHNIWNCDKGAQIEHNNSSPRSVQKSICNYSPVGTCHFKAQPFIFKCLLPTSPEEIVLNSLYCGGLLFQHHGQITTKQTHTGRENRLQAPHQARLLEHASAVPRHRWVGPHGLEYPSFDHLGCGLTYKERNVYIHVSMHFIRGKWFPVSVADCVCFVEVCLCCLFSTTTLQHKH